MEKKKQTVEHVSKVRPEVLRRHLASISKHRDKIQSSYEQKRLQNRTISTSFDNLLSKTFLTQKSPQTSKKSRHETVVLQNMHADIKSLRQEIDRAQGVFNRYEAEVNNLGDEIQRERN